MFKWLIKQKNPCDTCEHEYVEALRKNAETNDRLGRALKEREKFDDAFSSLAVELK